VDNKIIPVAEPWIGEKEKEYVDQCMEDGWISSLGRFVTRFEEEFSQFCGVRYGVAVCNGTAAIHLALASLGVGPGDEVLIPSLTFIATANAVHSTGARVVCVDSEIETWNMDVEDLKKKISSKTKAILPVHLYGHPCEMGEIMEIASKKDLLVVEDCAEAHGAEYDDKRVGSMGDVGAFSFYPNKIITTGEGGMVTTDNKKVYEKAHFLRDMAMSQTQRYYHSEIGYNYRMTNMQAAIGVAQMERIEEFIAVKRKNALLYNRLLKDVDGITLPSEKPNVKNVYWMYSIVVEEDFLCSRDDLMKKLWENGIDTRPFFHPINLQPPYKGMPSCPIAEDLGKRGINLPSSVKLTENQIEKIAAAIGAVAND